MVRPLRCSVDLGAQEKVAELVRLLSRRVRPPFALPGSPKCNVATFLAERSCFEDCLLASELRRQNKLGWPYIPGVILAAIRQRRGALAQAPASIDALHVRAVQNVLAPFVGFHDGGPYDADESDK